MFRLRKVEENERSGLGIFTKLKKGSGNEDMAQNKLLPIKKVIK